MATTAGTRAVNRGWLFGGHVARAGIGMLIGVVAVQVAIALMSLGSVDPRVLPGRLYLMVEPSGGVSAFAAFAATAAAVWMTRRVGGRTAELSAVAVWTLIAVFSLEVGSLCMGRVCDLPAAHSFSRNGYAVGALLTGVTSLFLGRKTPQPS